MTLPRIYCALDMPCVDSMMTMARALKDQPVGFKLGMEFFNAEGPAGVRALQAACPHSSLFIDLKYHDIPNTVAGAVRAVAQLAPDYLNVHATGGLAMMQAARAALDDVATVTGKRPKLLAVTVLTSMDATGFAEIGHNGPIVDQVVRLAQLSKQAGLDGVVCSPLEIAAVRAACGPDFILMVPGIRPTQVADDQRRVMTPAAAVAAGAHHLVIGRPITEAPNPSQALQDILAGL